jgi:hypothetical protein
MIIVIVIVIVIVIMSLFSLLLFIARPGSWVKAWDVRWARVVQGQFHTDRHLLATNNSSSMPFQPLFHATVFLSNRRVRILPF